MESKGNTKTMAIIAILGVIVAGAFAPVFMYTQNADRANFSEILLPLLIFCGLGFIIALPLFLLSKSWSKSSISAIICVFVLVNYNFITTLVAGIPNLRYWHIAPTVIVILLHIIYFICKKMSTNTAYNVNKIITLAFSALILFNVVIAIPDITTKISYERESARLKEEQRKVAAQNSGTHHPNIYYLVFDEYASFNQIKEDYGYDNSAFAQYLESLGFNVSYSSRNEIHSTEVVMTNIMNLEYIVSPQDSSSQMQLHRHTNKLFSILRGNNYTITGFGDSSFYGLNSSVDFTSSKTLDGQTITDLLLSNTIISPFKARNQSNDIKQMLLEMEQLKSGEFPKYNSFILSHFLQPHVPYAFDENGNELLGVNRFDTKNKKYYLGNYVYTTKLILTIVEKITKNDPASIIILTSDHGARGGDARFSMNNMCQILNAVYYRGEILDIEGFSGINTLRTVLNELFSLDFEMLDLPKDYRD
jgi:Phosphoglycerol transferase and related proteins, alkaline phosphatase superfamily